MLGVRPLPVAAAAQWVTPRDYTEYGGVDPTYMVSDFRRVFNPDNTLVSLTHTHTYTHAVSLILLLLAETSVPANGFSQSVDRAHGTGWPPHISSGTGSTQSQTDCQR